MSLDIAAVVATGPSIGGPATFPPAGSAAAAAGAQFTALLDARHGVDEQSARVNDASDGAVPETVPGSFSAPDLVVPTIILAAETIDSGRPGCNFRSATRAVRLAEGTDEGAKTVSAAADRDEEEAESDVLAALGSPLPPPAPPIDIVPTDPIPGDLRTVTVASDAESAKTIAAPSADPVLSDDEVAQDDLPTFPRDGSVESLQAYQAISTMDASQVPANGNDAGRLPPPSMNRTTKEEPQQGRPRHVHQRVDRDRKSVV